MIKQMKPASHEKKRRFYRDVSLVFKVLALTLAVCAAVWIALDYMQAQDIRRFFLAELDKKLEIQAKENRMRFNRRVQSHAQAGKLIISQQRFQSYVLWAEWHDRKGPGTIRHIRSPSTPEWLPSQSVLSSFFHARLALLIDPGGQVREIYRPFPGNLPPVFLKPGNVLREMSHSQSYLTDIEAFPWVLSSHSLLDEAGQTTAVLMLASPLDNEFLMAVQGNSDRSEIAVLTLAEKGSQQIIASSAPNSLPPGVTVDDIPEEKYIKAGASHFDGAVELDTRLISFVKTEEARYLAKQVLNKSKQQRAWLSLVLMSVFVAVAFSITWRLRRITRHIITFSREHLGLEPSGTGDEIARIFMAAQQLRDGIANSMAQANAIAAGDYSSNTKVLSKNDQLGWALSDMTRTLRRLDAENTKRNWIKTGEARLYEQMRGEQNIAKLANNVIALLTVYLHARAGIFHLAPESEPEKSLSKTNESPQSIQDPTGLHRDFRTGILAEDALRLKPIAAHGCEASLTDSSCLYEGLAEQALLEEEDILIAREPENPLLPESGEGSLQNILAIPLFFEGNVNGVIELGFAGKLTDGNLEFLHQAAVNIGIAVHAAESHLQQQALLEQTGNQAEELRSQTEQLLVQTQESQARQERLRQANEEMEKHTRELERQRDEIRAKNRLLEQSRNTISKKAEELEQSNRYKSAFLINISQELRPPLNSLLVVSDILANDKDRNLTEKQTEFVRTINRSCLDLLGLIDGMKEQSEVRPPT
ncbi:MAG: GAF domain-containing protein [Gammaproteobacteria bacterium]|nr:GAF domain-containing protein [Gammaproteobacteria bacterium]